MHNEYMLAAQRQLPLVVFKSKEGKTIGRVLMCCYVVQSRSVISIIVTALIFGYWIGRIFRGEKEKDQTGDTRRRSTEVSHIRRHQCMMHWMHVRVCASVYLGQHSDKAVGRSFLKLSCLFRITNKYECPWHVRLASSSHHQQGKQNEHTKHIPDRSRGREETGRRRR